MQSGWRKRGQWDWTKEWASLFHSILPEHVCEAAMATCCITFQGPESVGNRAKNWGQWIRMRMQTFGQTPYHLAAAVQRSGHWISTDSREAVTVILGCFDLTLDNVFAYFGEPDEGEKWTLDLCNIVTTLDADFAATREEMEMELVG